MSIREDMQAINQSEFYVYTDRERTLGIPMLGFENNWLPIMVNQPNSVSQFDGFARILPYPFSDSSYLYPPDKDEPCTYFLYHSGTVKFRCDGYYFIKVVKDEEYVDLKHKALQIVNSDSLTLRNIPTKVDGFRVQSVYDNSVFTPSDELLEFLLDVSQFGDLNSVKSALLQCIRNPFSPIDYSSLIK